MLALRCRYRAPRVVRLPAWHNGHGDGSARRDLLEELASHRRAGVVATLVLALVIGRKAPRVGWTAEKAILHARVKGRAVLVLVHHRGAPVAEANDQRPAGAASLGQPAAASGKGLGMARSCRGYRGARSLRPWIGPLP